MECAGAARARLGAALRRTGVRCGAVPRSISTSAVRRAGALQSALMVTRSPVLLRTPTPLEREYYRFNRALGDAVSQPFPKELYFKKGSAAEARFDAYYRALQQTWDVGTETKTPESLAGAAANRGSEGPENEESLYATMPRTTRADEACDVRSLERALDRTLYLVVAPKGDQRGAPAWRFPAKEVKREDRGSETTLHGTATDAVTDAFGNTMDLWLVSKLPIAVLPGAEAKVRTPAGAAPTNLQTYVLKAHVLAGEPEPVDANLDYAWLTKEEIRERLLADQRPEAHAYWEKLDALLDE